MKQRVGELTLRTVWLFEKFRIFYSMTVSVIKKFRNFSSMNFKMFCVFNFTFYHTERLLETRVKNQPTRVNLNALHLMDRRCSQNRCFPEIIPVIWPERWMILIKLLTSTEYPFQLPHSHHRNDTKQQPPKNLLYFCRATIKMRGNCLSHFLFGTTAAVAGENYMNKNYFSFQLLFFAGI